MNRDREALIAPRKGDFKGGLERHPSSYRICAAIPHFDTLEPLRACVNLLQNQSVRPYIVIVDTGSPKKVCDKMQDVFGDDVEIHFMRAHGWTHASEPVAAALDLAQAICRSPLMFHTHADCFLRDRRFLERWGKVCNANNPVIGYRMSDRSWATNEWEWMVGHTATMLYMPTIHRIGATWSYQRVHALGYRSVEGISGWPDTETAFNHALRNAGIIPQFIGDDVNHKRQTDAQIDHVRSYAGSSIYSEAYHATATEWMKAALSEARHRAREWSALNLAEQSAPPYQRENSRSLCSSPSR